MQFHIPQFIDIEDKIFGPLSFRQFLYVLGAAGSIFLAWSLLPTVLAVMIGVPISAVALLLAFKPVHGRPFSVLLESVFKYITRSRLYLWRQEEVKEEKKQKIQFSKGTEESASAIPRVRVGKLDDLSWSLDVQNSKQE